jgi:hypothetical protein
LDAAWFAIGSIAPDSGIPDENWEKFTPPKAEFEADSKFIWEVKRDWYGLDFIYLRDHPESLFWQVFLDCEYTRDYQLAFMPAEGLRLQVDHIKTYYQRRDEKVQALYERPYIYLSQAEMDRFVEETTQQLYRIYQLLWEEGVDTSDFSSALELLSDMEVEL